MQKTSKDDAATEPSITIARRILRYLKSNAGSRDTIEGICEWWLLHDRIEETVSHISNGVAWLMTKGYLSEIPNPGGKVLYEVNPMKHKEVIEFLSSASGED